MTTLIDRYIDAATDDFPGGDDVSVAREIRAALEDIVEAKMAQGMSREDAERVAVEEVGDPQLFARQFRDAPQYLIGPDLFQPWWATIRTVLAIFLPIMVVLAGIEIAVDSDVNAGEAIGKTIGAAFTAVVQVAFWVTLTFVIIERTGNAASITGVFDRNRKWTATDLPDTRVDRQITVSDVVLNLVMFLGAVFLLLRIRAEQSGAFGMDHLFGVEAGSPFFNPGLSTAWGFALAALLVLSLGLAIWRYIGRYWTAHALAITVMENLAWIAFIVLLGFQGSILNPALITASRESDAGISIDQDKSTAIIVAVVVLVSLWDIVESVIGHVRYRRMRATGASPV